MQNASKKNVEMFCCVKNKCHICTVFINEMKRIKLNDYGETHFIAAISASSEKPVATPDTNVERGTR